MSSCLAGRFFVRLRSRFLAGPSHSAYGEASGFFVLTHPERFFFRGRYAHVRWFVQSTSIFSWEIIRPADIGVFSCTQ